MSETALQQIRQLLKTPERAGLGPGRRLGTQAQSALNATLDKLFREAALPEGRRRLVRSLILLWHDHLDASHEISQGIENADGSFIHAIMHRREPDYWNSKYWWRRVGSHPAFSEIGRRVSGLLKERGAGDLAGKLVPGGRWNAAAFVDECEKVADDASGDQTEVLREIQQIEFEVLLESFLSAS